MALLKEPLTSLIVEVQRSGDLRASLCSSAARLAFYAQGVHELFGLPVAVALFRPEDIAFVKVECDLAGVVEELLKYKGDYQAARLASKRAACKKYFPARCENCAFATYCPDSKG